MSKGDAMRVASMFWVGAILADVMFNSGSFARYARAILEAIMMAKKYVVHIGINDQTWGEYPVIAANRTSAAFIAGMKFQREEKADPGDWITCDVVVPPAE